MFSISLRKHLRPLLECAPLICALNIYTYIYRLFLNHIWTALRTTRFRWEAKSRYCYSNQKHCPTTLIISARYLQSHSKPILDIWKQFQYLQETICSITLLWMICNFFPSLSICKQLTSVFLKTLTSQKDPIANFPVLFAYYPTTSFTARNLILIWWALVKKHHKINYSSRCPPEIRLC